VEWGVGSGSDEKKRETKKTKKKNSVNKKDIVKIKKQNKKEARDVAVHASRFTHSLNTLNGSRESLPAERRLLLSMC
jgi:hypothetical protein